MLRAVISILILATVTGCQEPAPTVTEVSRGIFQVTIGGGVSLDVIEWGGSGQPLVFLGGGGATAHFFDDFAPLLVDDFRVLGITRRGLGASSDVPPDDFEDLVEDIVAVLDAMELGSVVLVGHSFAGFEMTRFAERHVDRCSGLVYLDAAYDYSTGDVARIYRETPPPEAPPMSAADSASLESVRAWYKRTQGFIPPASEIRARGLFDSDGRYLGRKPITATRRRFESLEKPPVDLDALDCPSFGLFPVPGPLRFWLPYYGELGAQERQKADAWQEAFASWAAAQRANFDRYPHNQVVEFPNSGHMFFLERPEEASRAIRDFVLGLE